MKINKKMLIGALAVAVLASVSLVYAAAGAKVRNEDTGYTQNFSFFVATTTSATSTTVATGNDAGYFRIAGAKKVTMYFSRGDTTGQGNSGASRFSVQVTPDGTNWYDFNRLSQNVATSSSEWLIGTDTISAATTTRLDSLDITRGAFLGVRCIVVETTDGEHTCKATAEF